MIFLPHIGAAENMSEDPSSSCSTTVKDSGEPELGKWSRTACVGPKSIKSEETDFNAFSLSPVEEMYLELVSPSIAKMLSDKSNWNNRLSAIGDIEKTLKQTSSVLSDADLKRVVDLIAISVNDSQSKVSQKGLQVMEYLAKLVGKRLAPYLSSLTLKILIKVSSNKGNLKKAGMSLFKTLMDGVGPMRVINEVVSSGLRYKTSRVREEAINVIISAVLRYENGSIQLLPIAKELTVCMMDSKAKVRQASFEAMALITKILEENNIGFSQVIEMVANAHKFMKTSEDSGVSLMDAYQSRLARGLIPSLDENGLVQYSIPVLRSSSEFLYSGPDVDWICAGAVPGGVSSNHSQSSSTSPPEVVQNAPQMPPTLTPNVSQESTFRPYRSAGKRPWETENKDQVS